MSGTDGRIRAVRLDGAAPKRENCNVERQFCLHWLPAGLPTTCRSQFTGGVHDNLSDMPIWNPIMDEFSGQILISKESKINVSTEKVGVWTADLQILEKCDV